MQSQNKEFNHASCEEDLGNAALRKSEEEASFVQLPKRVYSMDACPKQEAMIKMPSDVSQHVRENALNYLGERLHRIILLHHKKTPEGYPEILDRCRYFYVVLTDRFAVRGYRRHSSETLVKEVNLFQYGNCEVCVMTPATFKVKWEAREFPYYSETFLELYRKVDFRKEAVQVMARPPEGKREFPSKAHEQTYTQLLDSGRYFSARSGFRIRNAMDYGPGRTGWLWGLVQPANRFWPGKSPKSWTHTCARFLWGTGFPAGPTPSPAPWWSFWRPYWPIPEWS